MFNAAHDQVYVFVCERIFFLLVKFIRFINKIRQFLYSFLSLFPSFFIVRTRFLVFQSPGLCLFLFFLCVNFSINFCFDYVLSVRLFCCLVQCVSVFHLPYSKCYCGVDKFSCCSHIISIVFSFMLFRCADLAKADLSKSPH